MISEAFETLSDVETKEFVLYLQRPREKGIYLKD